MDKIIFSSNIGIVFFFYLLTKQARPTIKFVFIPFWNSDEGWLFCQDNSENIFSRILPCILWSYQELTHSCDDHP